MIQKFAKRVYETLQGLLVAEAVVPDVENLFEEGKLCAQLYSNMADAYERICGRLGVINEDSDVETIINSLMGIADILAIRMFQYGAYFAQHSDKE